MDIIYHLLLVFTIIIDYIISTEVLLNIKADTPNFKQDGLITDLENKLSQLEKEQSSLNNSLKKLKKKELRYHNIFKNSAVAIWEEDFSEAYTILKKLPCKTEKEYSDYLDNDHNLLNKLFTTIKILDVNLATIKLHGAKNKEELISSLDKIFTKDSYSTLRDQFASLASGAHYYKCETTGQKLNGENFNVMLTAFFPNNRGEKVFITTMDISDRILQENKQSSILKEIEEKKKIADILVEITFELASKTDQKDILETILKQIEKVVPYSSANIMLVENNKLIVAKHRGYDKFGADEFMTKFAENIAKEGAAKTFRDNHQTQIIEDTQISKDWKIFPETTYIESFLSIPIEWQGNVIGLLNLDSTQKGKFSQNDINTLKPINQAAAISIQKARLFAKAENEILERKKTETKLKNSLKEKEILLREIHHRVKNNLTIIVALINLQDTKFSNPEETELFEDLNQRIHSIALVHEKLYENQDLSNIDFASYALDLFNSIRSVIVFRSDITFKIDIPENIYFSLDRLIPLGLTLNELLTNSLKYAFTEIGGEISLKLETIGNYYTLCVKDSGIGYPEQVLKGNYTQLGLILVSSLVDQINGTLEFNNINGAYVTIEFPILEKF
ncbi:MAG: GAF domain-containing protein [Spirochaetia bacterium]|nr:GAF domain-containing protein [Spirochaetia bacterium]